MIDSINMTVDGKLYAGENVSNSVTVSNFTPKDGANYYIRFRATDGNIFVSSLTGNQISIDGSLIPTEGFLTAELCEKIGDEYIALSKQIMFRVNSSIPDSENAPPTYEQAKSLAERAIEAADRAEDAADRVDAGIEVYYPEFTIDDDGHLIFTAAEQSSLDFRLNGNDLEVIING